jgi:hypothetical protein
VEGEVVAEVGFSWGPPEDNLTAGALEAKVAAGGDHRTDWPLTADKAAGDSGQPWPLTAANVGRLPSIDPPPDPPSDLGGVPAASRPGRAEHQAPSSPSPQDVVTTLEAKGSHFGDEGRESALAELESCRQPPSAVLNVATQLDDREDGVDTIARAISFLKALEAGARVREAWAQANKAKARTGERVS